MQIAFPAWVYLLATGFPVLSAPLLTVRFLRPACYRLAALTALPSLALAAFAETGHYASIRSLFLTATVCLDGVGKIFLLVSAVVWLVAAIHSTGYMRNADRRPMFYLCFLAAMSGNLTLTVAADAVTFYAAFALMSFASYGLVVHRGDSEARRAAMVYIVLVVAGEVLIFPPLAIGSTASSSLLISEVRSALAHSPDAAVLSALLLLGFGIKAGVMPLHVWLPLAHPAAPTPASAVLSGCMIKAGLLGWIRFLPLGELAMPATATAGVVLAVMTALGASVVGLVQENPKTLLAYSSISKMGWMMLLVALGLYDPDAAPYAISGISVYAFFHALNKGALFLGCSVTPGTNPHTGTGRLVSGALLFAALAFAAGPMLAGAYAKTALKHTVTNSGFPELAALKSALVLGALLTALLMARFVWLTWPKGGRDFHGPTRPETAAWLGLLVLLASFPALLVGLGFPDTVEYSLRPSSVWAALWPILLALAIALPVLRMGIRRPVVIPAGDLLGLYEAVLRKAYGIMPRPVIALFQRESSYALQIAPPPALWRLWQTGLQRGEASSLRWAVGGLLYLAVVTAILVILLLASYGKI